MQTDSFCRTKIPGLVAVVVFFSLFVFPFNYHCVFKNTHFLHTQEYLHTKEQTNLFRVGLLTARDLLT